MKIAILGTKGVPNNYGGFEQFAEYISIGLVGHGHSVTVYNPSYHYYKESSYKGVTIKRIFSPEKYLGSAANFIYDHLCLKHALKQGFDIIYEAGYHSVALSFVLLGIKKIRSPIIITNMDGLEWKRSKWNALTRGVIRFLEKKAVAHSHYLISDNIGIQQYYRANFNKDSFFIPYGANIINKFDKSILQEYDLEPFKYDLIVARLEPENNIEMILKSYGKSNQGRQLIIIGNYHTKYGSSLRSRYQSDLYRFQGGIYNRQHLDSIRYFSFIYFHGHSVGGTNPSLLEAMACRCFIVAHNNPFNLNVLNESALFFSDQNQLTNIVSGINCSRKVNYEKFTNLNLDRISTKYSWDIITEQHELLFESLIQKACK